MALFEGRWFTGRMTDQRYNTDSFAAYHRHFLTNGVKDKTSDMQVTSGGGNAVNIGFGIAMVDGYLVSIIDNQSGPLRVAAASGSNRWDRLVIRKDATAQTVSIVLKPGTSAAPPLQQDDVIFEESLARVQITGAGAIGTIIDERREGFTIRASDVVTNAGETVEAAIKRTSDGLLLAVSQSDLTGLETRLNSAELRITPTAITNTVTQNISGNTIKSIINQSATSIKLQAGQLDLTGLVTITNLATSGAVTINGAYYSAQNSQGRVTLDPSGLLQIFNSSGTKVAGFCSLNSKIGLAAGFLTDNPNNPATYAEIGTVSINDPVAGRTVGQGISFKHNNTSGTNLEGAKFLSDIYSQSGAYHPRFRIGFRGWPAMIQGYDPKNGGTTNSTRNGQLSLYSDEYFNSSANRHEPRSAVLLQSGGVWTQYYDTSFREMSRTSVTANGVNLIRYNTAGTEIARLMVDDDGVRGYTPATGTVNLLAGGGGRPAVQTFGFASGLYARDGTRNQWWRNPSSNEVTFFFDVGGTGIANGRTIATLTAECRPGSGYFHFTGYCVRANGERHFCIVRMNSNGNITVLYPVAWSDVNQVTCNGTFVAGA